VRRLLVSHLAVFVVGAAVLRIAVVPPEVCPSLETEAAEAAIDEAAGWLERGLRPDGRFTYGYDRARDEVSRSYNTTRHAGVLLGLYQVAASGDGSRLAAADAGLAYVLGNLLRRDGWTAFAVPGEEVRIGPSALALAALVHRRLATGDPAHDALMRGLGRFLVAQLQPDGSILGSWSPVTGLPVPGLYAKFGTGEALWAFALMHRLFPGEGWDRPARRLVRYVATRRDDVEGYLLTFPDHWAAYALAELGPDALGKEEIAYARRLAGALGLSSRMEAQSQGRGLNRLVRGEPASGAGLGSIGEGLAALWRLSRADPRLADLEDDLAERLSCTAARTVERQADAREAAGYPRPSLVRGAWFSEGGYTQMDDQRHALSALLASLRLREADGRR
jgi:hypothetical protein